tara:strand:- start:12 stop:380 length:369 start_codon:yes stop_codon:yes gene_type:complete
MVKVSDDILIVGMVGIGAFAFYSVYKTGNFLNRGVDVVTAPVEYGAGKVDDAQDYAVTKVDQAQSFLKSGWDRVFGAPEWAWRETLGQGGIKLTGNEPVSTDARGFWKKDEGSYLWGWGPKK